MTGILTLRGGLAIPLMTILAHFGCFHNLEDYSDGRTVDFALDEKPTLYFERLYKVRTHDLQNAIGYIYAIALRGRRMSHLTKNVIRNEGKFF